MNSSSDIVPASPPWRRRTDDRARRGFLLADDEHARASSASPPCGSARRASRCGRRARRAAPPPTGVAATARAPSRRTGPRPAARRPAPGAIQNGKLPAVCSIRIPRKRSSEPRIARWSTTGRCVLAVLADVGQVEALRLLEVALDRAELPGAADRVLDAEVDLRAVEGAVARRHDVRAPRLLERRGERRLAAVPLLVGADPLLGAQAERDLDVREPERRRRRRP